MSSSRDLAAQVTQLKTVFEACDRAGKGYITCDDVCAATQHLPEEERRRLLELLGAVDGRVDYQTFWRRVTAILELGDPSPLQRRRNRASFKRSTDFSLSSPFKPRHNSSYVAEDFSVGKSDQWEADEEEDKDLFEAREIRSTRKKFREKRKSKFIPAESDSSEPSLRLGDHPLAKDLHDFVVTRDLSTSRKPRIATRDLISSRDPRVVSRDLSASRVPRVVSRDLSASRDPRVISRDLSASREPRAFRNYPESGFSSGSGSPTDTVKLVEEEVSQQLSSKMTAVETRLDQINETARQSRNEISNLVDLVINRSFDRGDSVERVIQNAKEVWQMEKELIEDFHNKEVEELRHINELLSRKIEEDAVIAKDGHSKKKQEVNNHLEDKIYELRKANNELVDELAAVKVNNENMKNHFFLLEERNKSGQEEIEETKIRIGQQKEEVREEKNKLSLERKELKAKYEELFIEREELMAEKKIIQIELDFLKQEKERFYFEKAFPINNKNDHSFVMIETTSNYENMFKENQTLKASLERLADERSTISEALKEAFKDKVKIENEYILLKESKFQLENKFEEYISNDGDRLDSKIKLLTSEIDDQKEIIIELSKEKESLKKTIKENEDVIKNLMDIVDGHKGTVTKKQCLEEWNKDLKDQNKIMVENLRELDRCMNDAQEKNNYLQNIEKEHDLQIVAQTKVIKELREEVTNLVEDKLALAADHDSMNQYVKSVMKKFTRTKSGSNIGESGSLDRRTSSTSRLFSKSSSPANIVE